MGEVEYFSGEVWVVMACEPGGAASHQSDVELVGEVVVFVEGNGWPYVLFDVGDVVDLPFPDLLALVGERLCPHAGTLDGEFVVGAAAGRAMLNQIRAYFSSG
ncbi:hypothetical protein ACFYSW_28890 [Rhodococcus aetherivorans]|uniref:hypothetical protein n=1 Tax=Rhodococcus aetherivorans TaxID=191292 RepID=UPI0036AD00D2